MLLAQVSCKGRGSPRRCYHQPPHTPTRPIRLLIVDDHSVVRHGLRAVFETHRDIEIVGEAADVPTATTLASTADCDVALVDARLGDASGIDVIRALRRDRPSCRAVLLTGYGTEHEVAGALEAGAQGCVLENADPVEIVNAVRARLSRASAAPAPCFSRTSRKCRHSRLERRRVHHGGTETTEEDGEFFASEKNPSVTSVPPW